MDTLDEALGCALQQVQPIKISDLSGTRTYEQLRKAHNARKPPPKLMVQLSLDLNDNLVAENWNQEFDNTTVYVERVIAYWSRTFKLVEVQYSTTEREALAAKEGLVKFQPFIEGEKLALVTDHATLQWAKTSVLYSAPPIPAGILRNPQESTGILRNPQEWHRNPQESSGIHRNGTGIELELGEIRYNTFARYIYTNMHFCTL